MPKKIKDVETRIMEAAKTLYKQKGFEQTDMKEIAKLSGVAVGTLYNYWPSKKALFNDVSHEYWGKIFLKFDKIMESSVDARLKSMLFVKNLYDCFETQISTKNGGIDPEEVAFLINTSEAWSGIHKRLSILLRELAKKENMNETEDECNRISRLLSLAIISGIIDYPHEKEANIEFINRMLMKHYG